MKTFRERGFNDELDLDTLVTVFLNRINPLISVFVISTFCIAIYYLFQERVYQSSALLQFETNSTLLPSSLMETNQQDTALSAEKEIFKSISTIEGAVNRLNDDYEVDLKNEIISKNISFDDDRNELLTIYYASNDRDITKPILDNLIKEFISDRIENNRIAAIRGIDFIDEEIPKLKDQLSIAEIELSEFRSSGGISFIFGDESRKDSIESLNQEIKDIELKEIELKEFYKTNHPLYSTLIEQKNILLRELEDIEIGISDLPSEQRKLFNLNQKVNIYSSSLEELERQKLSLSLIAASSTSNVRIINFPSEAIKISPRISLLLFGLVFLLFAYFIFLINHFFTDKIMSLDSLLDYLEDRSLLLGAFPLINENKNTKGILEDIEKNFIDRIVINILNSKKRIFLVTSMKEGVGKSYFSEKLLNSLSHFSEKICLLDLDLRKKGISEYSDNFKKFGKSVEEYLDGKIDIESQLYLKKPIVDDTLAFLNSADLDNLIEKLKNDFDKIIIDSPPLGTFVDAKIISEKVEQSICILSSHESSFAEISSITSELEIGSNDENKIIFFLNKVRYFLEIFWFNVRYPLYGGYNYYNPYNYYSNQTKGLRKFKKYVSFAAEIIKKRYKLFVDLIKNYFNKK